MKKITLLLLAMILPLGLMAQEFPIDFESPEDDNWSAFNGATAAVVADPTDATNTVLGLDSAGADFDGASLGMGTYIDLSDDANNTITMEVWAPDDTARTHLLKIEGSATGAGNTELTFTTDMMGWQTVSVDFGAGLGNDYAIMTIFMDSTPGNTATGQYYIDDINGTNGAVIPTDPTPAGPAPVPTVADSDVYSIYNDTNGYTTTFPVAYSFGTLSGEPDLDPSATENKALKFNFGVAGWGQGEGGPDDVSSYSFFSFNYWAGAGTPGFNIELIENVGGNVVGTTYQFGATNETIVEESWQTVNIPLSEFTNAGFDANALFQWKFDPLGQDVNNAGIVYVDNIMFTNTQLNVVAFEQSTITAYPNPSSDAWNINLDNANIQTVEVLNTLGQSVKTITVNDSSVRIDVSDLATGLYFAKIQNENNQFQTIKLVKN